MTLETFRTISIPLDTANDAIPPVRLNAGDDEGRVITAIVTDAGRPITDTGLTAGLAWNPRPEDPSSVGASTPMTRGTATLPDGSQTVTFTAPVPRALLAANPGRARLGIEIAGPDGMIVCSRNITAIIEPSVVNATAPEISDPLTELRNAAETAAKAAADAKQAVSDANAATDEANRVISTASISGGVTTTLPPNSPATSTLKGSGLTRTLDLGIPRGAGVTTVEASELDPILSPRASLDKQSNGDYKLSLSLPRAARFRGTSVTTLNPSQEPTAELNMGGSMSGDYDLLLGLPRAARVTTVTATALQTPTATVETDVDGNGDIAFRFGIPTGGPGPKGDKGDPGDAGQVATQTVAGVVKPGKGLTVRADGTLDAAASGYTLPPATTSTLGGVKPGDGLKVDDTGRLSVKVSGGGLQLSNGSLQWDSRFWFPVYNRSGLSGTGAEMQGVAMRVKSVGFSVENLWMVHLDQLATVQVSSGTYGFGFHLRKDSGGTVELLPWRSGATRTVMDLPPVYESGGVVRLQYEPPGHYWFAENLNVTGSNPYEMHVSLLMQEA